MRAIIITPFILLAFAACEKDKPQAQKEYIEMSLQPVFGSQSFFMDSIYTTQEGFKVKFTELKCYFSLFANNSLALHQASLFDFRETDKQLFKIEGDYKQFEHLNCILGVDSSLNHLDPSAFENTSPLNISNAGPMHWGWNPGYIFINIEGKVDTIPDANLITDHSFSFHIGSDINAQALGWSNINWTDIGQNTHEFKLKLDLLNFLGEGSNSIQLNSEFLTHSAAGQQALTQKVVDNFKNAISPF